MIFKRTEISDVVLIQPKIFKDERGYFLESFKKKQFREEIGDIEFVQENESKSSLGVIRGLHYQIPPYVQSKLVRVVYGSVLDIAVDIRETSPTFGKYVSIELNDENKYQLFIPQGFAHGFITLSEFAILQYKVDNHYSKEHDRGIIYNDPSIKINWPNNRNYIISKKDLILPTLEDAEVF